MASYANVLHSVGSLPQRCALKLFNGLSITYPCLYSQYRTASCTRSLGQICQLVLMILACFPGVFNGLIWAEDAVCSRRSASLFDGRCCTCLLALQ